MDLTMGRQIVAGLLFFGSAMLPAMSHATSISYYLDQSNIAEPTSLVDGINYLKVTIDDEGGFGVINFTVQALSPLSTIAGSNFGIQQFGFNSTLDTSGITSANFINLPSGWSLDAPPGTITNDGFGNFDIEMSDGGTNRKTGFSFSIAGVDGDTVYSYIDGSITSNGGIPAQGSVYFVAHVAGFRDPGGAATSGYFGGSTPVPLPSAVILMLSSLWILVLLREKTIA